MENWNGRWMILFSSSKNWKTKKKSICQMSKWKRKIISHVHFTKKQKKIHAEMGVGVRGIIFSRVLPVPEKLNKWEKNLFFLFFGFILPAQNFWLESPWTEHHSDCYLIHSFAYFFFIRRSFLLMDRKTCITFNFSVFYFQSSNGWQND